MDILLHVETVSRYARPHTSPSATRWGIPPVKEAPRKRYKLTDWNVEIAKAQAETSFARRVDVGRERSLTQDPGVRCLEHGVTLASRGFQTLSVENRELAAAIADQFTLA